MSDLIKFRKGTDAQRQSVIFELGEPIWTTDTQKMYIGDGVTSGGVLPETSNRGLILDPNIIDGNTAWNVYPDGISILFPNNDATFPMSAPNVQIQTLKSESHGASQFLLGDGHKKYRYATAAEQLNYYTAIPDQSGAANTTIPDTVGILKATGDGRMKISANTNNSWLSMATVHGEPLEVTGKITNIENALNPDINTDSAGQWLITLQVMHGLSFVFSFYGINNIGWTWYITGQNWLSNQAVPKQGQLGSGVDLNSLEFYVKYDENKLGSLWLKINDSTVTTVTDAYGDWSAAYNPTLPAWEIATSSLAWAGDLILENFVSSYTGSWCPASALISQTTIQSILSPHGWTEWQTWDDVSSVNGMLGDVTLDFNDVGADAVGTAGIVQTNLDTHTTNMANPHNVTALSTGAIPTTEKGVANGIATLDSSGIIPSAQLPALAITDVNVVANITARDALIVQEGDVAVVTDIGNGLSDTFIYNGSSWITLEKPDDLTAHLNDTNGHVQLLDPNIVSGNTNWSEYPDGLSILFPNDDGTFPISAPDVQIQTIKNSTHGASQYLLGDGNKKYRYATSQATFTKSTIVTDFSGTAGTNGTLQDTYYLGGTAIPFADYLKVDGTGRAYIPAGTLAKTDTLITGNNQGSVIHELFDVKEPWRLYFKFTNFLNAWTGAGANGIMVFNVGLMRFQLNINTDGSLLTIFQSSDAGAVSQGIPSWLVTSPLATFHPDVLEVEFKFDGITTSALVILDGTTYVLYSGDIDLTLVNTQEMTSYFYMFQGGSYNPILQDNLYIESHQREGKLLTQAFGIETTESSPSVINPLPNWTAWQTWDDVESVNGKKGVVVLNSTDVGADPVGSAAAIQVNLDIETTNRVAADATIQANLSTHEAQMNSQLQKIEVLHWMGV